MRIEEPTPPRLSPSQYVLQYFGYQHLPAPLKVVSGAVAGLALHMEATLPDGPEKTMGIRKLLEAKDCFVRSMLEGPDKPWWQTTDLTEMSLGHGESSVTPEEFKTNPITLLETDQVSRDAQWTEQYLKGSKDDPEFAPKDEPPLATPAGREQALAANVIKGKCYGPIIVEGEGLDRHAHCYWATCKWGKARAVDGSVAELQQEHNDAGAELVP